jgi:hypothetical protein
VLWGLAHEQFRPAQLSFARGNVHGHQGCGLRSRDHRLDRRGDVVLRCRANRDHYNNKLSYICSDDVRNAVADRALKIYQRGTAEFRSQGRSSAARCAAPWQRGLLEGHLQGERTLPASRYASAAKSVPG